MNSPTSLPQKWSKLPDGFSDNLTYEHQSCYNLHPFALPGFGKCYLHNEAHILLSLRSGDGQEFLACIQRDWRDIAGGIDLDHHAGTEPERPYLIQQIADDLLAFGSRASSVFEGHGQQQTMLVDVVQGVENVKQGVPSLVWADTAECFNRLLTRAIYHSQTRYFPVFGVTSYWELGLGRNAAGTDQAASHVVQRTTEIVQHVPDDERHVVRDSGNILDVVRYVSSVGILLDANRARFDFPPCLNSGLELLDVLLGPMMLR